MKKLIFVFCLLIFINYPAVYGQTQGRNDFRMLEEFGNDTTRYLHGNYRISKCFVNVPVSKMFTYIDPRLPFKTLIVSTLGGDCLRFNMFCESIDELKSKLKANKEVMGVECILLKIITPSFNEDVYNLFRDRIGIHKIVPFPKETFLELAGDLMLDYSNVFIVNNMEQLYFYGTLPDKDK